MKRARTSALQHAVVGLLRRGGLASRGGDGPTLRALVEEVGGPFGQIHRRRRLVDALIHGLPARRQAERQDRLLTGLLAQALELGPGLLGELLAGRRAVLLLERPVEALDHLGDVALALRCAASGRRQRDEPDERERADAIQSPSSSSSRSSSAWVSTLPCGLRGSSSMNSISRGTLYLASFSLTCDLSSSSETSPSLTTKAFRRSPNSSSSTPTTAASETPWCSSRVSWTSSGYTFSPPETIMLSERPSTKSLPSSSRWPRSPVV